MTIASDSISLSRSERVDTNMNTPKAANNKVSFTAIITSTRLGIVIGRDILDAELNKLLSVGIEKSLMQFSFRIADLQYLRFRFDRI